MTLCASCVDYPAAGTRLMLRTFGPGKRAFYLCTSCCSMVDRGHKPSSGNHSRFRY